MSRASWQAVCRQYANTTDPRTGLGSSIPRSVRMHPWSTPEPPGMRNFAETVPELKSFRSRLFSRDFLEKSDRERPARRRAPGHQKQASSASLVQRQATSKKGRETSKKGRETSKKGRETSKKGRETS